LGRRVGTATQGVADDLGPAPFPSGPAAVSAEGGNPLTSATAIGGDLFEEAFGTATQAGPTGDFNVVPVAFGGTAVSAEDGCLVTSAAARGGDLFADAFGTATQGGWNTGGGNAPDWEGGDAKWGFAARRSPVAPDWEWRGESEGGVVVQRRGAQDREGTDVYEGGVAVQSPSPATLDREEADEYQLWFTAQRNPTTPDWVNPEGREASGGGVAVQSRGAQDSTGAPDRKGTDEFGGGFEVQSNPAVPDSDWANAYEGEGTFQNPPEQRPARIAGSPRERIGLFSDAVVETFPETAALPASDFRPDSFEAAMYSPPVVRPARVAGSPRERIGLFSDAVDPFPDTASDVGPDTFGGEVAIYRPSVVRPARVAATSVDRQRCATTHKLKEVCLCDTCRDPANAAIGEATGKYI